jgi:hypothetical protein
MIFTPVNELIVNDDDIIVVTSNDSSGSTSCFLTAFSLIAPAQQSKIRTRNKNAFPFLPPILVAPVQQSKWAYAALTIALNEAIADLGAT